MLCQICHKNPATLHIEEAVETKKSTLHLCSDCAKVLQADADTGDNLKLAAIAYQIATDKLKTLSTGPPPNVPTQTCSTCATTLAEYHSTGRLGCPDCYKSFRGYLQPILERMHRGTSHTGTAPPDAEQATRPPAPNSVAPTSQDGTQAPPPAPPPAPESIALLRKQLDQAVKAEKYEQAAKLRDRIQNLTSAENPDKT